MKLRARINEEFDDQNSIFRADEKMNSIERNNHVYDDQNSIFKRMKE